MYSRCLLSKALVRTNGLLLSHSAAASHVIQHETSCLQKAVLAIGSGLGGLMNPERTDLVFTFGETTGQFALQYMRSKMMKDKVGREILESKPRIRTNTIDLDSLRTFPDGTLGSEYIKFIDHYGYSPDGRAEVKYVDDPELAYVMQRYRELHDFLHTLLGMPTSVYGEIIVKQFEAVQTGLPLCVLGGLFAPVKLSPSQQIEMTTVYGPWAIRNGLFGKCFMNFYFEKHLEVTIDELRRQLNFEAPPKGSLSPNSVWH